MKHQAGSPGDWRCAAIESVRAALVPWRGQLRPLAAQAVDHLDAVLGAGDGSQIAALAVPVAVHAGLRGSHPPPWLLAAAGATYLAWSVLDNDMDGDPPRFWSESSAAERSIGAHLLIATAAAQAPIGAVPSLVPTLAQIYLDMVATVTDGQLRAEVRLDEQTAPEDVTAGIEARSGAMLAGFADLTAVAAGTGADIRRAVRRFGRELAMARQLVNDITELESGRTSDLRNETATMTAAFALQRAAAADRAALVDRLRAAAFDESLRRQMIDGELQPALVDTRMLARLHLVGAARAAESFVGSEEGRAVSDALIDYTLGPLVDGAITRAQAGNA